MNMTITLGVILLILVLVATILIIVNNSMKKTGVVPTTPVPTSTTLAPVPTRTTISTTSTTPSSNFAGSLWGFVKVVAGIAALIVVIGFLILGIGWVVGLVDNWTGGSNTSKGESVTIVPGSYVTIPINQGASRIDFAPPEMTVVEYLDANEDPLPVYKNGQVEYSLITGPGVDDEIDTSGGLCFVRFSSAGSNSEYSFMFYQK